MPINVIDYSDSKEGEKGNKIKKLCDNEWEMPIQIETLESWLKDNRDSLKKGNYVADLGFSPREGALGGGAILTTEAMEIMSSIGMELFLSEYPSCE